MWEVLAQWSRDTWHVVGNPENWHSSAIFILFTEAQWVKSTSTYLPPKNHEVSAVYLQGPAMPNGFMDCKTGLIELDLVPVSTV